MFFFHLLSPYLTIKDNVVNYPIKDLTLIKKHLNAITRIYLRLEFFQD